MVHATFVKQEINKHYSESVMEGTFKFPVDWNTWEKAVQSLWETCPFWLHFILKEINKTL